MVLEKYAVQETFLVLSRNIKTPTIVNKNNISKGYLVKYFLNEKLRKLLIIINDNSVVNHVIQNRKGCVVQTTFIKKGIKNKIATILKKLKPLFKRG